MEISQSNVTVYGFLKEHTHGREFQVTARGLGPLDVVHCPTELTSLAKLAGRSILQSLLRSKKGHLFGFETAYAKVIMDIAATHTLDHQIPEPCGTTIASGNPAVIPALLDVQADMRMTPAIMNEFHLIYDLVLVHPTLTEVPVAYDLPVCDRFILKSGLHPRGLAVLTSVSRLVGLTELSQVIIRVNRLLNHTEFALAIVLALKRLVDHDIIAPSYVMQTQTLAMMGWTKHVFVDDIQQFSSYCPSRLFSDMLLNEFLERGLFAFRAMLRNTGLFHQCQKGELGQNIQGTLPLCPQITTESLEQSRMFQHMTCDIDLVHVPPHGTPRLYMNQK